MVYILAAISGREVILLGSVENCKGAPWMQWCRKLQASSLKRTHRGLEGPSWASNARVRRGGDEDRHNLQNRIRGHGQGQRSGWCAAPHARIPRQTFGPALHIIRPRPVVPSQCDVIPEILWCRRHGVVVQHREKVGCIGGCRVG